MFGDYAWTPLAVFGSGCGTKTRTHAAMSGSVGRALLLLCGLGLGLGLGVELPSRLGQCAGELCAFQESVELEEAQELCGEMLGQLSPLDSDLAVLRRVLRNFSGPAWLDSKDRAGNCLYVTPEPRKYWRTCGGKLSGFVCQYRAEDVCRGVTAAGGAPVGYSTTTGFSLDGSDTFPPGAIAVAQRPGDEYPDSKSLCFSGRWLKTPWNCEVLTGGCAHNCSAGACRCPEGHDLHENGVSCVPRPTPAPECGPGFRPGPDGKTCVEANGCEAGNECEAGGGECVSNHGSPACLCAHGFDWEDGACVDISICFLCEQGKCYKQDGVYRCACLEGFTVSPQNPTKCVRKCTVRDCPATCDKNEKHQCYCPDGYVADEVNGTVFCTDIDECENRMCEHHCDNSFGGYRCGCAPGFELQDGYRCVRLVYHEEEEEGAEGSGAEPPTQSTATAAGLQPAALPQYIKTGSILGITVFLLLCVVLLALLTRNAVKRCGRFELSTFKHPDLDIYYLQQVSTETYKRLSLDRQQKNDPQRP
ncbi:thrombomodulin-like [Salarias fasciatus]|uniref:Thrombomodulin n=1 Tax=Salarias fasciatus TaxID=181472 RepID=A0A672HQE6_SALFA|nr:thrombomodulin-like [Salarias fasciatus]